jgi:hypothetical protein
MDVKIKINKLNSNIGTSPCMEGIVGLMVHH